MNAEGKAADVINELCRDNNQIIPPPPPVLMYEIRKKSA